MAGSPRHKGGKGNREVGLLYTYKTLIFQQLECESEMQLPQQKVSATYRYLTKKAS